MTSYKEVYEKGILDIWLDISTFCNAACPACHRTERLKPGLGKVNWLPLIQWSIDEFKSVYNKEMIERTRRWEFCGTFGDPAMNKDLVKMTKYILNLIHIKIIRRTIKINLIDSKNNKKKKYKK